MGNLGMYQVMTTMSSRVGGPIPFMALLVISGVAIGIVIGKAVEHAHEQPAI